MSERIDLDAILDRDTLSQLRAQIVGCPTIPTESIDDIMSAALLRCIEATASKPTSELGRLLPMLATADRGQAMRRFRNVGRQTMSNLRRSQTVAHPELRAAALEADGPVMRPDFDDARRLTGALEGAEVARSLPGHGDKTLPKTTRIVREQTLETMLTAEMKAAQRFGHEDRSDDHYAGRRQREAILTGATPILPGAASAEIAAAIEASGRTLGALLYEYYDMTTPRGRGAIEATEEESVIRWTAMLRDLGLPHGPAAKNHTRKLVAMARALVASTMTTDARYAGASVATSLPFPGRTVA